MLRRFTALLISTVSIIALATQASFAATATSGSSDGMKVSPLRTELTIAPGGTSTVNIDIGNVTNSISRLKTVINDFTAKNETGTPALYLKNSNVYNPHSLRQFVQPVGIITLQPHQQQVVKIVLKVPANTSGGGYYGAVRFEPVSSSSNKNVSLSASVASLILLKVPGPGMKEQVSLSNFAVEDNSQTGSFFFSNKGLGVQAVFDNSGNVQEEPFGKIIVKNMSGKVVLVKDLNTGNPPGNVLPSSQRLFTIPLSHIGSFGKYTIYGNFGYGTTGQLLSAKTSFYVVAPWIIILAIVILVLIIGGIILMPKLFRAWYRRSVKKGNG